MHFLQLLFWRVRCPRVVAGVSDCRQQLEEYLVDFLDKNLEQEAKKSRFKMLLFVVEEAIAVVGERLGRLIFIGRDVLVFL